MVSMSLCRVLCAHHLQMQRNWLQKAKGLTFSSHASISSQSSQSTPGSSAKSPTHPSSGSLTSRIRNVGIIAHIDAGKTTTTERFLYYSGLTGEMGEVHDGDTVTDYMDQERERGITITSAAVTFPWIKHRINLIDTPGHVDFTVEVERSLSVLDSALVVLDASAGVEAQTITVWSQADRHHVPRLVYLNKMDKQTADVDLCLKSIRKLGSKPLLLHHPIKSSAKDFDGIVDLVSMNKMLWSKGSDGSAFTTESLTENDSLYQECSDKREQLIASLSDVDEMIVEAILKSDSIRDIAADVIMKSLRKVTIDRSFIPVLMGSSFKKVAVQSLMDAIVTILPSPADVMKRNTKYFSGFFCGLAFKVIHHKMLGPLTFVRIYSGELKANSKVYNVNRSRSEHVHRIYVALADDFKEVPLLSAGNIVVVTGLECITGDTLVTSANILDEVKRRYSIDAANRSHEILPESSSGMHPSPDAEYALNEETDDASSMQSLIPLLAGPLVPDPVFFCSIEAPSPSKQKDLESALTQLQREDPSLKVKTDDSGQIVVSGMGELHIEILKDRLLKEYDANAFLGPLQIAYRESIEVEVKGVANVSKTIAGVKNYVNMIIVLKPGDLDLKKSPLKVVITQDNDLGKLRKEWRKSIDNGIRSALTCGPLLNFPVIGARVELLWFECSPSTSAAFISSTTANTVTAALKHANVCLMEPLMKLEITVPTSYSNRIISDLSSRRSQLGEVSDRNDVRYIESVTPLSDLVNYSSALRSLSSGTATLSMQFLSYRRMTESEKRIAKEKVTGFVA